MLKPPRLPLYYMYLDGPGIDSLYAQIVDAVETSHTTTTQKGMSAKGGAGLRLKNFFIRLLSGLEGEASLEVTGSQGRTEQSTKVQTVEQRLQKILEFLSASGEGYFFTSLGDASRHLQTADGPIFVNIRDTFNAPQFYGEAIGADRVNADGYLSLVKGGPADYCYGDDYYKQPTAAVMISASVTKMRGGGLMAATSHEAIYLRGFSGRQIPLSVFGTLNGTPQYLQIKPFAIWR